LAALFVFVPADANAQDAALTGAVSSQEEGQMEGVVVSAQRGGAIFTVSVVSDAQGRYSFPRTHLEPGSYAISTRAVGYDLVDPGPVEVTANAPATRDLTLRATEDLPSQLSSLEWIMSMPGTTEQKELLAYQGLSCAYCHTYERIVKSRHSPDQFGSVIRRMSTYFNDGTAVGRGNRGRAERWYQARVDQVLAQPAERSPLGDYLATVNLSDDRTTWPYELQTLARPTGKATRVIMTQWDMPRPGIVPHDMAMAADGTPWYADQSRMIIGKLDPETNEFTEYSMPPLPEGRVGGISDIDVDHQGNVWFPASQPEGTCYFGTPTRFHVESETFETIEDPEDNCLQFVDVGPDGKVWMNNISQMVRVNPETMAIDGSFNFTEGPNVPPGFHVGYQVVVNSVGDGYISDFSGSGVIGVDGTTGEVDFWPTPDPGVLPRRGQMDAEDGYWFAEYGGDKISRFDTRTETFQQYPLPLKFTTPYAVSAPDKDGRIYASSNMSERVLRLDPQTGEVVEYQVPTDFDSKELIFDPTTDRPVLWMANTRNARFLKVEPLD
jgi:streptogramin lyase